MMPIYTGFLPDGRRLLMSFTKNWKTEIGEIHWKQIRCWLWFSNIDEVNEFVATHQEVPEFEPEGHDEKNVENWTPHYTNKMKFDA